MKWTPCIAMICITILMTVALLQGINGALFGIAIAAISGLGGYSLKGYIESKKGG